VNSDLEAASQRVTRLSKDPGNEAKLKLYALYKQATIGPCNKDKPGMFDLVGRAKWDAWNQLGSMEKSEASQQYCTTVEELVAADQSSAGSDAGSSAEYQEIVVTDEGGARTIMLNRPHKYNAITLQMYQEIKAALEAAGQDDRVVCTVLTGAGDYYCSGNDLSNFTQIPPEGPQKMAADAQESLREFVSTFIHFPKPLIAGVNGPAVGISVTLLALCDLVYAADHATFHTPFMSLGQSPEGCSSLLFPRFMGPAQANEILMAGVKVTSTEAYERGLVTRVYPRAEFQQKLTEVAQHIASLPPMSLQKSKALIRSGLKQQLEAVNKEECELLEERWLSDECAAAIIRFMQRKK
jgi:peroxisomal 3,2-trans-enoyl-CoA isomerase